MKKNRTMRIATLMLALTLITCCFVGSTFAKYTSFVTDGSTATVAKWSIDLNGTELTTNTPAFAFNLFETTHTNVADKTGEGKYLIAPGTEGAFDLEITNNAEVNAEYTITFEESNTGNIPLQYSIDGTTWVDDIDDLADIKDVAIAMGNDDTKTIQWRWVFNDTDVAVDDGSAHEGQTNATDTQLGINAQNTPATVTITATILVEQVD